jgi:hypothetical protein
MLPLELEKNGIDNRGFFFLFIFTRTVKRSTCPWIYFLKPRVIGYFSPCGTSFLVVIVLGEVKFNLLKIENKKKSLMRAKHMFAAPAVFG